MSNAIKLLEDINEYVQTIETLEENKHLDVYDMLIDVQSRYNTLKMNDFLNNALYLMYKRYNQNSEGEYVKQMNEGLKKGENEYAKNKFKMITEYLKERADFISTTTGHKL